MKIEKLTKMILISILLYLNEKFAVKQQLDAKLCAPFFKVFPLPCNLYLLVACEIDFRKDPCVLCIKYFRVCVKVNFRFFQVNNFTLSILHHLITVWNKKFLSKNACAKWIKQTKNFKIIVTFL